VAHVAKIIDVARDALEGDGGVAPATNGQMRKVKDWPGVSRESAPPRMGAAMIGCALPAALRRATPKREFSKSGSGMKGNPSGCATTPTVVPALVTRVESTGQR
jgi:hypothetical protein